ncbi:MAG: DUF362 domain-containing protein [Promethearchaeota archaeon]
MKIGKVTHIMSADKHAFTNLIQGLDLKPPVIVKPNWGFSVVFTEAKVLDWVLEALDGEALVVESYGWARCKEAVYEKRYGSMEPDDLRASDKWFLEYSGIGEVLAKHNVEFLNVTEEVWAGRIADPTVIKQRVEDMFPAVHNEEMYAFVPSRLFELQGGAFLSLSKLKFMPPEGDHPPIDISLSIKNLFGMIPGPGRGKFHGKENSLMNQSIVDMNKIYRSLFTVKGVVEAVQTASRGMSLEPVIFDSPSLAWACEDTVELDATVAAHVGLEPGEVNHIRLAAECFGKWSNTGISQARETPVTTFQE